VGTERTRPKESDPLAWVPQAAVALSAAARNSHGVASRLAASGPAPVLVLLVGTAVVAGFAAEVGVRVTSFLLDETLFKQSALHYYLDGFPGSLIHDLNARGTARLYPLMLAPVFGLFDGDVAVRVARALGAALFSSASIPTYMLARGLLRTRWGAVGAALLSVAVPWLTLGTTLFTENLAYPGLLWTALAIRAALRRPAVWRDGIAVVAVVLLTCVRVQFAGVFLAYLVLIALAEWRRGRDAQRTGWDVAIAAHGIVRRFPVSAVLVVAGLVGFAVLAQRNQLHHELQVLLGSYSEIQDRSTVPSQMGLAFLVEVISVSLGVGLAPALIAIAWYCSVLTGTASRQAREFATVSLWILAAVWGVALIAQGNYNGPLTEERYYIYAVPFVWIACFAGLERRDLRPTTILPVGIGFALLFATITLQVRLTADAAVLAPASAAVGHLLGDLVSSIETRLNRSGLSPRDVLALAALCLSGATAWTWRAAPRARLAVAVAIPAVVQCALTVYVFAVTDGRAAGVEGRTGSGFATLGWIDRTTPVGTDVAWLNNQARRNSASTDAEQRSALFWNSRIRAVAEIAGAPLPPTNFPLNALPTTRFEVSTADGELVPGLTWGRVVQSTNSPFVQLAGRRMATSRDGRLELVTPGRSARAAWLTTGLGPDGGIQPRAGVRLWLFGPSPVRVTFTFASGQVAGRIRVDLDRRHRQVRLSASGPQERVEFIACPTSREPVSGRLRGEGARRNATGRTVAVIESVRLTPAPSGCPT
jgi:hypothetical protein